MPRHAWTNSPLAIHGWRPMDGVTRITVHHSGDGKPFLATSTTDTIRHLQLVREAHLQRGMVDIAYHFAVDRAGRVWQLRSLVYEGQHVRPSKDRRIFWNEHNIGIVTLGDFNLQSPTPAQINRLIAFLHLVRAKYALPLSRLSIHQELVQTDCPGRHLAPSSKTPAPAAPPEQSANNIPLPPLIRNHFPKFSRRSKIDAVSSRIAS